MSICTCHDSARNPLRPRPFESRAAENIRFTAGALLASLAIAMLCALPQFGHLRVPLVYLQLVPLLAYFIARTLQARQAHRRAPTGVLLIGALSNAGGLAFHAWIILQSWLRAERSHPFRLQQQLEGSTQHFVRRILTEVRVPQRGTKDEVEGCSPS